jgi:hypothetical protein
MSNQEKQQWVPDRFIFSRYGFNSSFLDELELSQKINVIRITDGAAGTLWGSGQPAPRLWKREDVEDFIIMQALEAERRSINLAKAANEKAMFFASGGTEDEWNSRLTT